MKRIIFMIACCVVFTPIGKISAAEGDGAVTVQQDTEKTIKDADHYAQETKEHYVRRIRKDLDGVKWKITLREKDLSGKADQWGQDTHATLQEKISSLRRQAKALETQLHTVQAGGEKDVDHWKADIDRGMKDLKKGYDDLLDGMKIK